MTRKRATTTAPWSSQRGQTGPRAANQRADAQRNRTKILQATLAAISRNAEASIAEIATEAGVGRMTLYGHFPTRPELVEAALVYSLDRGEEVLSTVPLDGNPTEAFQRLVAASWTLVDQSRALLTAAQRELPANRIRELHEKAEARMRELLMRGQQEGAFRTDLPVTWLLTTTHVVMNGAAEEVRAGRLKPQEAPRAINAILTPAFASTLTAATPASKP